MSQAGFCTQCNSNVWLNPDGSCVNGHPASSVTGAYEAGSAPVQSAPQKNPVPIILGIVAAIFGLILLCGIVVAIAVPVFLNASSGAQTNSCDANKRLILGAGATFAAVNPGVTLPADFDAQMDLLVPSVLKKVPTCPSGGDYYFTDPTNPSSLTCSMHRGLP